MNRAKSSAEKNQSCCARKHRVYLFSEEKNRDNRSKALRMNGEYAYFRSSDRAMIHRKKSVHYQGRTCVVLRVANFLVPRRRIVKRLGADSL